MQSFVNIFGALLNSVKAVGSTAEGDNQDTLGPFPDVMPDSYRLKLTIRRTTGEGVPRRAIDGAVRERAPNNKRWTS